MCNGIPHPSGLLLNAQQKLGEKVVIVGITGRRQEAGQIPVRRFWNVCLNLRGACIVSQIVGCLYDALCGCFAGRFAFVIVKHPGDSRDRYPSGLGNLVKRNSHNSTS